MRNKELKVGDKVWIYAPHMAISSGYIVKSVKKSGTSVSIVVEVECFNNEFYEFKMYGHCNSSILSGFDRKWGDDDVCYTCDYSLIQKKTDKYESEQKQLNAGRALLEIVKYFK